MSVAEPGGPDIRYVIITRNSARWLGPILDSYGNLGIAPFVLLDDSSDDGTERLLVERGIGHAKVKAEHPRVESMVRLIPEHVGSEWVARFDDDELPSRALVAWIGEKLAGLGRDVVGVQRLTVRLVDGGCEYSRHPLIVSPYSAIDPQFRLYRPARVRHRDDIHTPGFYIPPGSPIAPRRCSMVHFEWLVLSAGERRRKAAAYDRQRPGAGKSVLPVKVWEDGAVADHDFCKLPTDEFDALAERLAGG